MKILAIDTTNKNCIVALSNNDKIYYKNIISTCSTSEFLLPTIEDMLLDANLKLNELDAVAVVVGPGSFTGIRVGVTEVKAFLIDEKIKGISINNFDLIKSCINNLPDDYMILINSGTKDIYVQNSDGDMYYVPIEQLKNVEISLYCSLSDYEYFLSIGIKVSSVDVLPKNLLDLAIIKYNNFEFYTSNELQPVYIKLSQAEREFLDKLNLTLTLKLCEENDIFEIQSLENDLFDYNVYSQKSLLEDLNNKNTLFLVAKYNQKIIGYIIVNIIEGNSEILKIAVHKSYQRLGIATKLFNEIKKYYSGDLFLEVSDKNIAALSLYYKLGFEKINERKKYYSNGDNCIVLKNTI